MSEKFIAGAHIYDPPREPGLKRFKGLSTDPEGRNWLEIVSSRSYIPLQNSGVLRQMSYDINPILLNEFEKNKIDYRGFIEGQADNVIGTSYIHPILPDLNDDDKRIVIGAGLKRYVEDFGSKPKIFWSPEAAMDTATAKVLIEFGYEAFICAPWQVQLADGGRADNQPVKIDLGRGNIIVALPYDAEMHNEIAFGDVSNADRFRDKHVIPKKNETNPLMFWVDGETFGHHRRFADLFIHYLLTQSLPEVGINPLPINQLSLKELRLKEARLVERTAWSCKCGNLARWSGPCGCSSGNDVSWKSGYYKLFRDLNSQISKIARADLGRDYVPLVIAQFEQAFNNPGGIFTNPRESLISAVVDSLTALTSCATFFDSPHTSGRINIVFALEAIQHLRESGHSSEAGKLELFLMNGLNEIRDPENPYGTLRDVTESMLNNKILVASAYV